MEAKLQTQELFSISQSFTVNTFRTPVALQIPDTSCCGQKNRREIATTFGWCTAFTSTCLHGIQIYTTILLGQPCSRSSVVRSLYDLAPIDVQPFFVSRRPLPLRQSIPGGRVLSDTNWRRGCFRFQLSFAELGSGNQQCLP